MPNYRRAYVPGGSYFITVVTHRKRRLFHVAANRGLLGDVIRQWQVEWLIEMHVIVPPPDHLHAIWRLPPNDTEWRVNK